MKAAVTRLAVVLGNILVTAILTGSAFAQCGAISKISSSVLFLPQFSDGQSAIFLSVTANAADDPSTTAAAAEGGAPIVGLWNVLYTSGLGVPAFHTYQQFHGDGLEIETPEFAPGVCMGTWKQTTAARTVKIFHVGFTQGAIPGTYRFELRELDTVSPDRNSFQGWYDQKFFDRDGNLVTEDKGTLQGTRLSVEQF